MRDRNDVALALNGWLRFIGYVKKEEIGIIKFFLKKILSRPYGRRLSSVVVEEDIRKLII